MEGEGRKGKKAGAKGENNDDEKERGASSSKIGRSKSRLTVTFPNSKVDTPERDGASNPSYSSLSRLIQAMKFFTFAFAVDIFPGHTCG